MWKYLPLIFFISPAYAIPVVPNFNSATSTSRSVTTNNLTEQIREVRYNSGYTYSVSGTGVELQNSGSMIPSAVQTNGTTDGVSYSWTGLDFSTKPTFVQTENGAPFQLSEHYSGPGLSNVTTINRTITVESTQVSQSIFQK